MPVYGFSLCTSTISYLIWKIEESLETLRPQLPTQFLADFQNENLSSPDRIRQSLAVRVALCYLLEKLNLPISPLAKNERGKPILDYSSLYVSFTHTRYVAAVALSTSFPIGIDIEVVRSNLHAVQARFLCAKEVKDANNCLAKLAIYWCAKEALYKRLDKQQIASFKDIFIEPFQLLTAGKIIAHLNQKKYAIDYQQIVNTTMPPHVLAYSEN